MKKAGIIKFYGWSVENLYNQHFSKETVRVEHEHKRNAEMRKSIADEGGYYDGRQYYRVEKKGNWFDDDSIISITR